MDWRTAKLGFADVHVHDGTSEPALQQSDRWYGICCQALVGEPSPLVEAAHAWLQYNAPVTPGRRSSTADPGPGNYMHDSGRVVAAVDFEFTHIGDPEDDWAYLIAMRGAGVMPLSDRVLRVARLTGVRLAPKRLRYWKCMNFFKGACIDQTATDTERSSL